MRLMLSWELGPTNIISYKGEINHLPSACLILRFYDLFSRIFSFFSTVVRVVLFNKNWQSLVNVLVGDKALWNALDVSRLPEKRVRGSCAAVGLCSGSLNLTILVIGINIGWEFFLKRNEIKTDLVVKVYFDKDQTRISTLLASRHQNVSMLRGKINVMVFIFEVLQWKVKMIFLK